MARRALYTGDAFASDSDYAAALDGFVGAGGVEGAETTADVATWFGPQGDVRDVTELISGRNGGLGDKMTWGQYGLTVVGAALPFVGGAALRRFFRANDATIDATRRQLDDAAGIGNTKAIDGAAQFQKPVRSPVPEVPTGGLRARMGNPPSGMIKPQAHHDLPQAERFRPHWDRVGLDIDDPAFGRWVEGGPVGDHQKWSAEFNREWDKFFNANSMATREEILNQMNRLRIDPRFQ